jgi:uncharacterized protein (DUF1330 family)
MTDHHVDPTREAFEAFKALPRDQPIEMLNLVRYRAQAAYPVDHPAAATPQTGAQAYAAYARASGPIFARVGGTIVWSGAPRVMLIGPADEAWDAAFIARYPSASAFLEMATDPAYRAAVVHRQAAVETSRLLRTSPHEARGSTFG